MNTPQRQNIGVELTLLVVLATLWGGSYTFIKLGFATIPPVTLIAGRTLIAGLLLLLIMVWRGVRLPKDAATWRRCVGQRSSCRSAPSWNGRGL
jgi:drug/metabolite transporter (DMT)-like permease